MPWRLFHHSSHTGRGSQIAGFSHQHGLKHSPNQTILILPSPLMSESSMQPCPGPLCLEKPCTDLTEQIRQEFSAQDSRRSVSTFPSKRQSRFATHVHSTMRGRTRSWKQLQMCLIFQVLDQAQPLSTSCRKGSRSCDSWLTALDPKNPVYNFLIEYYGLKGQKGTRQTAQWAPKPQLLLQTADRITEIDQLTTTPILQSLEPEEVQFDGILLGGASGDDLGGTLHLKGAIPHADCIFIILHYTSAKCKIRKRLLLHSFGIETLYARH